MIINKIGYLPLEKGDERLLFQLIDRRYEKKSIIATSNIPFSEWSTLFSDEKVDSAMFGRLLHHTYVVPIIGNSYRKIMLVLNNCTFYFVTFVHFYINIYKYAKWTSQPSTILVYSSNANIIISSFFYFVYTSLLCSRNGIFSINHITII